MERNTHASAACQLMQPEAQRSGLAFRELANVVLTEHQRRGELYQLPVQQLWLLELTITGSECDALLGPVGWDELELASSEGFVATLRRTATEGAERGQPIIAVYYQASELAGVSIKFWPMPPDTRPCLLN